jgi:hypothetical protein
MTVSIKIADASFTNYVARLFVFANLSPSNFTETGDATTGYIYTSSAPAYANSSDYKVPSTYPGNISAKIVSQASNALPVILACATNNLTTFSGNANAKFGVFVDASGIYKITAGGTGNITANVVAARAYVANDIVRIRRANDGSCVAEISSNNGATFTTIHTYTAYSGDLFPMIETFSGAATISTVTVYGAVAV